MKRVGGKVTWLLEFEGRFETAVRDGLKRQTLRRCHIVEPGDTLRLASADTGRVFGEVTVARVRPVKVERVDGRGGICEGYAVIAGGRVLTFAEADALAGLDGFGSVEEMGAWLEAKGKFVRGVFDGQVIEW